MTGELSIRPAPRIARRWLITAAAVLATAAVLVAGAWIVLDRLDSCGANVFTFEDTDECVGVSDGSYQFRADDESDSYPALREIQRKIAAANGKVPDNSPYVRVVYLLPMPWQGQGGMLPEGVTSHLHGAFAAQVEANEGNSGRGTPKIRLLVANIGHDGVAWEPVAKWIIDNRAEQRIAVVAGFGQSLATTRSAAEMLSGAGIPMVGSTITADNLSGYHIEHLYRAAPTNTEEVDVGLSYLKRITPPEQQQAINGTFLVAAGNPDDDYVVQLERAFTNAFGDAYTTRTFDPLALGHTELVGRIAADICNQRSRVNVYYAGRSDALRTLITGIDAQCDPRSRVTILTGDDATNLVLRPVEDIRAALARRKVRLLYTGLAHPAQWGDGDPDGGSGAAMRRLAVLLGANVGAEADLNEGGSIMAYDAVTVSIAAVRRIGPAPESLADLGSLTNGFNSITKGEPVCGASGPIGLASRPETARGNPINKPIPVIEMKGDGSAHFTELAYPGDVVPRAGAQPPNPESVNWAGTCGAQPR